MPYLGDYLGHLLTEITNARVQADLETVRMAELYASHPLLKHMPVPHFRLPTVTMEVPVIIRELQPEKEDSRTPGEVLTTMRKSFEKILVSQITNLGIELKGRTREKLIPALDQALLNIKPIPKIPLSITNVTDEFVNSTVKVLRESRKEQEIVIDEEQLFHLEEQLKHASYVEFSRYLRAPPRLDVLVTTAELREAGPTDILAHIHLSISESGLEWTTVELKGKTQTRLVPE